MIMAGDATHEVGLTVATVALILAVYNQTLPDAHSVRTQPNAPEVIAITKKTVTNAAVLSIALGLGAGIMARSAWPMIAAAVTVTWMTTTYHLAAKA